MALIHHHASSSSKLGLPMDTIASTGTRDWSSLPKDIFYEISKYIPIKSRTDILCFRAVCRTFRQAVPLPPKRSLMLPLPPGAHTSLHGGHLLLKQSSVIYAIKPLQGITNAALCNKTTKTWLVRVEELSSGKVRVKNVLDGCPYEEHLSKKLLPKSLNLLDYRVEELAIAYGLKYVHNVGEGITAVNAAAIGSVSFKKVILSSSSCVDEIDDGFVIMAIKDGRSKLLVWRKGDGWSLIQFKDQRFADIAYHNEKFYALSVDGLILSVDSRTLDVTKLAKYKLANCPYLSEFGSYMYLVKSSKELFLIYKREYLYEGYDIEYPFSPFYLSVFKVDTQKDVEENTIDEDEDDDYDQIFDEGENEVDNLENKVLFCCNGCSFFVSAKEFSGRRNNCIFFNGDRIFKMDDYDGGDLSQFPSYANIFWPPPTWLKKEF